MSYQISTRATNVVVGDRVLKDHKWHSVDAITTEPSKGFDASATSVNLVFGNGSTIPLQNDDYIVVKRSSTATTPASLTETDEAELDAMLDEDAEQAEDDEDSDDEAGDDEPIWLDDDDLTGEDAA